MKQWCLLALTAFCVAGCSRGEPIALVGGESNLQQWRDRGVVINYWAEWCGPCRDEIPEFNDLYRNSPAGGPIVVGVNYDGLRGADLQEVIERMDIDFPTLLEDPRQRFGYERPSMMPTTIILDGDLLVKEVLVGPQTAESIGQALAH